MKRSAILSGRARRHRRIFAASANSCCRFCCARADLPWTQALDQDASALAGATKVRSPGTADCSRRRWGRPDGTRSRQTSTGVPVPPLAPCGAHMPGWEETGAVADGTTPAPRLGAQTYRYCCTWSVRWGAAARWGTAGEKGARAAVIFSRRNGSATRLNPSLASCKPRDLSAFGPIPKT